MPLGLDSIAECFRARKYFITKHGYEELDNDSITIEQLETAIGYDNPEVIETRPDDPRGASCLVIGWSELGAPIHICLNISNAEPEVVTAYRPDPLRFYPPDFRRRRR